MNYDAPIHSCQTLTFRSHSVCRVALRHGPRQTRHHARARAALLVVGVVGVAAVAPLRAGYPYHRTVGVVVVKWIRGGWG